MIIHPYNIFAQPSTLIVSPVMKLLSSEAREITVKEITFDPSYSLSQRLIRLRWKLL